MAYEVAEWASTSPTSWPARRTGRTRCGPTRRHGRCGPAQSPLLRDPVQAVFLLPTPRFRRDALAARYADPARARANWGDHDPETMLVKRLARDALWDDEVRRQAAHHGLDTIVIDGSIPVADLASQLAARFWLEP
ncbi:hypothetical protein [Nonomuraea polychroma]|uniref:hypothetical protein n=1 Tax=Nonomuraea polychroma TaxID=46176 RepID=UPI0013E2E9D7|nr:hypothetical protein [Nonomuraea polychroma]